MGKALVATFEWWETFKNFGRKSGAPFLHNLSRAMTEARHVPFRASTYLASILWDQLLDRRLMFRSHSHPLPQRMGASLSGCANPRLSKTSMVKQFSLTQE